MYNRSGKDTSSPGKLIDIMKQCHDFSDLPDDFNLQARSYRTSNMPPNIASMSEADRNNMKYEEYLRSKWHCAEAMPESFDPDKLEIIRKMKYRTSAGKVSSKKILEAPLVLEINDDESIGEPSPSEYTHPSLEDPSPEDISTDASVIDSLIDSIIESLNTEKQLEGYESDAVAVKGASTENMAKVKPRSKTVGQASQSPSVPTGPKREPRIKSGSKPPLSRSAFARGGETSIDESAQGVSGTTPIVYPRAPRYFPPKGRAGKKQK
ncbi:hypothetical protein F5X96DRAFT_691320 [Biscogniauxia mediterranea]|nr:hypothetical protein F5X96DRAFT_691320 [Biscogniauxia mediterranea]